MSISLWFEEDRALHMAIVAATRKDDQTMDNLKQQLSTSSTPPRPVAAAGRDLQLDPRNLELSTKQYDDIVLDGSGSMMSDWWEMLDAIDGYVDQLKINQLDSHIRLSIFTSGDPENMDLVARNTPISQWVPLCQDPVGSHFLGTPLYDAILATANRMRQLNPERAAVTFVTDGGENGSRFATLDQAKAMIQWMRAKGWQVTFIGCDFNNQRLAAQLGIDPKAAIGVHRAQIDQAIRTLADKRGKYGKTGEQMHWTDDEKKDFGGYLNAPPK